MNKQTLSFCEDEVMDLRMVVAAKADDYWTRTIIASALDGTSDNFRRGIEADNLDINQTDDGGIRLSSDEALDDGSLDLLYMSVMNAEFWYRGVTTETEKMATILLDAGCSVDEMMNTLMIDDVREVKQSINQHLAKR